MPNPVIIGLLCCLIGISIGGSIGNSMHHAAIDERLIHIEQLLENTDGQ